MNSFRKIIFLYSFIFLNVCIINADPECEARCMSLRAGTTAGAAISCFTAVLAATQPDKAGAVKLFFWMGAGFLSCCGGSLVVEKICCATSPISSNPSVTEMV